LLRLPTALDAALPTILELRDEIFRDLDDRVFGVGWWAPHPGISRRILISDYLCEATLSIQKNVTEAALHLLELLDFTEQENSFMADAVVRTPRGIAVATPPAISAKDELPVVMSDLHSAGFFRAAVGALDCLGASIVGITALPIPIS